MPLFAAAYVSVPTVAFSDRDLSDLLLSARRWNAEHGVTGKLVVAETDDRRVERFVQWLEGEADDVRAALRRIRADTRHDRLELQFFAPVPARRFATWDMAFETVPLAHFDDHHAAVVPEVAEVSIDDALGPDSENGA
jgi:hypothetical protein